MSSRPRALVISNIAWSFVWQRHQTMAKMLARDFDVTFCELPGIRAVRFSDAARILARARELRRGAEAAGDGDEAIRIIRPKVLPSTNGIFCAWNRRRLAKWVSNDADLHAQWDLVLVYSPARAALQLLDVVPHKRLIYDCTDDWLAVHGIPRHLPSDERRLLGIADLTLVPSRTLLARKKDFARRIERLPHGAMAERFLPRVVPPGPAEGPPVVLYYGHVLRQHLDLALIDELARIRPEWRFVLVGPVKSAHNFPGNVELRGQVAHEKLRDEIARARCLLLPYALNRYTEAVMPAKSYECLATGLPVVAAPLPELTAEFAGVMRFASDAGSFASEIRAALDESEERGSERIALAKENSWDRRYETLRTRLLEFGILHE